MYNYTYVKNTYFKNFPQPVQKYKIQCIKCPIYIDYFYKNKPHLFFNINKLNNITIVKTQIDKKIYKNLFFLYIKFILFTSRDNINALKLLIPMVIILELKRL